MWVVGCGLCDVGCGLWDNEGKQGGRADPLTSNEGKQGGMADPLSYGLSS